MKKLISILFLLPVFLFSQRTDVLVKGSIFTIHYSEVYEQPLSIVYKVECSNGTASRKGMDFYKCDSVKTSDAADYADNVYDKGHMAPAAAFSCSKETLWSTFTYLNCALQEQTLNRGAWRLLEEFERKLANEGKKSKVTIIVEYKNTIKLKTGATVPSGFYKKIEVEKGETYIYYFANAKPATSDYNTFKIAKWPFK